MTPSISPSLAIGTYRAPWSPDFAAMAAQGESPSWTPSARQSTRPVSHALPTAPRPFVTGVALALATGPAAATTDGERHTSWQVRVSPWGPRSHAAANCQPKLSPIASRTWENTSAIVREVARIRVSLS